MLERRRELDRKRVGRALLFGRVSRITHIDEEKGRYIGERLGQKL
jgi:hypothetical protein